MLKIIFILLLASLYNSYYIATINGDDTKTIELGNSVCINVNISSNYIFSASLFRDNTLEDECSHVKNCYLEHDTFRINNKYSIQINSDSDTNPYNFTVYYDYQINNCFADKIYNLILSIVCFILIIGACILLIVCCTNCISLIKKLC